MDDFVDKMVQKVGIDRSTAEKVIEFLKDHAKDAIEYLEKSHLKDRLPGPLSKLF
jgi:hypothetical protein